MPTENSTIALKGMEDFVFVSPKDVLYAKADGNYTYVTLAKRKEVKVLGEMKEIEALLPQEKFLKIHPLHIINLDHATSIHPGEKNFVIMTNGASIELAEDRRMEFIENFHRNRRQSN